jgi:MFS transporter, PAT family, beta-lactamase induction signal transducer AmpG
MSGDRPGTLASLARSMTSWRTASVALLSFSSGLPLGLVWIAIPDWMRRSGVDIRVVGLITLAQAPWTFKVAWSPLMDRFVPPWLGRRRGWAAIAQVTLLVLGLALAGLGNNPDSPWIVGALALAIAFAAATQDIAIDAYAVDVLRPEEQGVAVGARVAVYRAAMYVAGGLSITLAGQISWRMVNVGLALLYVPMLIVTWKAPEPAVSAPAPRSLREALWLPFLGFLSRHRALEILAFVFFFKFADNLAHALLRPFLVDMGYSDFDRGVALTTVSLVATLAGTFFGGALTNVIGLGNSLWLFGALQVFSNIGYILVARAGVNRPIMYGAMTFETLTSGMGTGAFSVLLLRMTQKRFSATQYALFSSLFGLPRLLSGPVSGFAVDALGWEAFFWLTILAGAPGLILLQRFSPLGVREPRFEVETAIRREPLSPGALTARGVAGGIGGFLFGILCLATMATLRAERATPANGFDFGAALTGLLRPEGAGGWLEILGLLVFAAIAGLMTAAVVAARRGAVDDAGDDAR